MSQEPASVQVASRARRPVQCVVAVLVTIAAMALPALSPTGAQTATPTPTAANGAAWLAGQIDAGIPMQNFGSGDWGVTLDAAIALAAAEVGAGQIDAAWSAMVTERDSVIDTFGSGDSPGRLARMILLAHAIGEDPTAVGTAPGSDLVARLVALEQTAGDDAGLFGPSSDATYDGAFRQGYALAALAAAGVQTGVAATQWLIDQQCDDGSWMPYRSDLAVPCAFDAAAFLGPDTNSTGAAITGLVAQDPAAPAIDDAAVWLEGIQNADGGWGFFPGDISEPSSIALVWQALVGADSTQVAATQYAPATPLTALASFQLGCSAPDADRGAYTYPGSNDAPNTFSTAQAVPVAAGTVIGFGPTEPSADAPVLDCTVPTTTTTTTSTTTTSTTTTTASPAPASPTVVVTPPAPASVAGAAVAGASVTGATGSVSGQSATRTISFTG